MIIIERRIEMDWESILETVSLIVVVGFIFVMFLGLSLAILGGLF
tara:strand:- start:304 stop:438 length:135 start_codon:yes stop_codon:yes gene_type:complete